MDKGKRTVTFIHMKNGKLNTRNHSDRKAKVVRSDCVIEESHRNPESALAYLKSTREYIQRKVL